MSDAEQAALARMKEGHAKLEIRRAKARKQNERLRTWAELVENSPLQKKAEQKRKRILKRQNKR